jgi:Na+/phosphate symporter
MVDLQHVVLGTLDDALEALGTGDPDAAVRAAESKADLGSPEQRCQIGHLGFY